MPPSIGIWRLSRRPLGTYVTHACGAASLSAPEGFSRAQEQLEAGHARVERQLVARQVQLGQRLADQPPHLRA